MRFFILAFFLIGSVAPAFGQSLHALRAFDDATKFANAGEFQMALKGYRSALMLNEDESTEFVAKIHYNLGVCLYRTNQLKPAVLELNKAVKIGGGKLEKAYYALGMTESALEDWQAAREAFLKAIAIRPDNGETWFDLAFVYLALRDHPSAANAFRKAIEFRSVDAALGHNNLGVILAINFEFDKAEAEFHNALNLSSGRLTAARWNIEFVRSIGSRQLIATDLSYERGGRSLARDL